MQAYAELGERLVALKANYETPIDGLFLTEREPIRAVRFQECLDATVRGSSSMPSSQSLRS